jgi:hypothetical protein
MSTVVVLTPIIIASWPAISAAVLGAVTSMGFASVSAGVDLDALTDENNRIETDVPNSEVVAETLKRGEKISMVKGNVLVEIGVDDRGRCTVCASGKSVSKSELLRISEEVSGRIVQQFAYNKLTTELKARGFEIASESMGADQSIHMRVRTAR